MSLLRQWRDRVFWSAHSVTWDSGAADGARIERQMDVAAWLEALGVAEGGEVLDLGCATGDLTVALAGAGFAVVGVDVSRGMLRRAERKTRGLSRRPTFQPVDLNEPLPFETGTFDCALCANVLQCVEHPARLLHETRRVLVRGGFLAVIGKLPGSRPSSPPAAATAARLFAPLKTWASRWARPLDEAALLEIARGAGFVDVRARSAGGRVELSGRAP